jgi:hypothetical protein
MDFLVRFYGPAFPMGGAGNPPREELVMQGEIFVAATIAFFIAAIGYVHFCERVK